MLLLVLIRFICIQWQFSVACLNGWFVWRGVGFPFAFFHMPIQYIVVFLVYDLLDHTLCHFVCSKRTRTHTPCSLYVRRKTLSAECVQKFLVRYLIQQKKYNVKVYLFDCERDGAGHRVVDEAKPNEEWNERTKNEIFKKKNQTRTTSPKFGCGPPERYDCYVSLFILAA